jgi:hypothetical protein
MRPPNGIHDAGRGESRLPKRGDKADHDCRIAGAPPHMAVGVDQHGTSISPALLALETERRIERELEGPPVHAGGPTSQARQKAANSDGSTVDGSDTAPRIVRMLRIRGIVARPDTEEESRRWDSNVHRCRCHSRGCTTHHEPGEPYYWCRPWELRQGEQPVLQQQL